MPKYSLGQVVQYRAEKERWLFIITGVLSSHSSRPYYACYCFKTPNNTVQIKDLHRNIQMSEIILDAV